MPSKKAIPHVKLLNATKMPGSTLVIALTGWMDGGAVSTGTVRQIMHGRELV